MIKIGSLLLLLFLLATACTKKTEPAPETKPVANASPQASTEAVASKTEPGALRPGEASGSCTARGETVELKYAYAGRGKRFGNDATIVLITDKPIPPESVANEIESQTLLYGGTIKGLEYVVDKDGYWVRFHPSQYQVSKSNQLVDFTIEGDVVRGSDEDKGELTDGKYSRAVKFVATIIK
jgi:hypothetical protein